MGAAQIPRGRRWHRYALGTLLAVFALLAAGLLVLNSPIGKRWVADRIADFAPVSGLRFQVGRIDGSLYGKAVLHDLVLSDPKGVFARIPETELDWRPLNWFTSGLDVRKLALHRGTLLRLPELEPGDPDAPILPNFDIRIDQLEIDRLTIAEGVIGERRRADFLAAVDIRKGRAKISAKGDFGGGDHLELALDAVPDGDVFDLELDYRAPKGGLLAGLAGAQDDLRLRVTGDGSWSRWDGAIHALQGGDRLAALQLTNRQGTYGILGEVYPAAYLPAGLQGAVGDKLAVSLRGELDSSVLSGRAVLIGAGARATAKGAIDLDGNAFRQVALSARIVDPAAFGTDMRLDNAVLIATLDGPFRNFSARHRLTADMLDLGGIQLAGFDQRGVLRGEGGRWTLPLDASVSRAALGIEMFDPRLVSGHLSGRVTLEDSRLASDVMELTFPGVRARLALRGDLARSVYGLAGPVEVSALALPDIGAADGLANLTLGFGAAPWQLGADVSGRLTRLDNGALATIAGDNIRFAAKVAVGGAQRLSFSNAHIEASKLALDLEGYREGDDTVLAGTGRHVQYGAFELAATLASDGPYVQLVLANPVPAAGLREVRVALRPQGDGFAIDTSGQSTLGPFDGALLLTTPPGGATRLVVERLDVWKTSVTGALLLGDAGANGTLVLAGGGLDGKIMLAPRGGGQGFALDLEATRASFGGATSIAIAQATAKLSGVFGEQKTSLSGDVQARGISYGTLFLGRLAARADMEDGSGDFTASASGRRGSRFAVQLAGTLAPDRYTLLAQGEYAGQKFAMPRRAVLTRPAEGGWQLAATQLSYGKGIAIVEASFGGSAAPAGSFKFDHMPLALLDIGLGETGLSGTLSGVVELRADQRGGPPLGRARLKLDKLTRAGLTLTSRPLDVALVADLSAEKLEARAVIDEAGTRRGSLQGKVTGLTRDGGLLDRLSAGRLFGQMRFTGPADSLWRLTGVEAFDLTGDVSVAADATGTLMNPLVRGSLAGDNMRLRSALIGADIREVKARGRFSGPQLRITQLSGKARNGGTISGSGTVDLSDIGQTLPQIDLRLSANRAQILDRADMGATVTGPIRVITRGNDGTVAGRLTVNEARWALGTAEAVEELPNIRTREINLPADIAPPAQRVRPWRYLIDIKADRGVDVRGLGLESEWSADIKLRGTTADPRVGGTANLVEGDYRFAGTRFDLTRGRIVFDADAPPNPQLDVLAESEVSGMIAQVAVTGSALRPEIRLSSVPSLPEEEILARLLFGGSFQSLSTIDAVQLGAALAAFRGGGGMDPINRLRSAIGLDRLRIVAPDPALDRGTAVAAGKNITDNLYAEIITDGAGYSATELEFRITSWLSLLASISTIGRESVSVEVRRDY